MLLVEHVEGEGWGKPAIVPFGPLSIHPAATVRQVFLTAPSVSPALLSLTMDHDLAGIAVQHSCFVPGPL